MSQIPLPPLDRAVLEIVAAGDGRHGWHAIATRLSTRDVPRTPGLMDVLADLRRRGLVARLPADGGDVWSATAAGAAALRAVADPLDALVAELGAGPAAAVAATRRLVAEGAALDATGAALLDRVDGASPGDGFVLAFALSLLPPPARAERVRAWIAARDHARLGAAVGAWAPLRVPDRGGFPLILPEPAWTEALAAALDGPLPAARTAAGLLALASDRVDPLLQRLRDRLDPAASFDRQVLDAIAGPPTPVPSRPTPIDWPSLLAATAAGADADVRELATLGARCDKVPSLARRAGVVMGSVEPAARLAVTAGPAALASALDPLIDRGLEPLLADPAMPESASGIATIGTLGLIAVASAVGRPLPLPDGLADRWLAYTGTKLAVMDEDDRRTAALAAVAFGRPERLPAFDKQGPLGRPRSPDDLSGMAYFAFARRLAEGGEAPRDAWAAIVDRFPLPLASGGALWTDLVLAAIGYGRLAGHGPAEALADLRARIAR